MATLLGPQQEAGEKCELALVVIQIPKIILVDVGVCMIMKTQRSRETKQRRIVYDTILNADLHPTADWIFQEVRTELPQISLATVYRNLSVLRENGKIHEVVGADRKAHYDGNLDPHAHFICTRCSDIWDVNDVIEKDVDWRALKDLVGCEVHECNLEFRGLCPPCRRNANV